MKVEQTANYTQVNIEGGGYVLISNTDEGIVVQVVDSTDDVIHDTWWLYTELQSEE